ncbi:MAG TPA: UdgX family uracil-DNA binding protein [Acidobacteriaceae bacterium]
MPKQLDLDTERLPDNIQECRRCDLWIHASQAVEGEGAADARIMLVGEQPGDEEDFRGHPFVGPAGRILDQCLDSAALRRDDVFLTNAVKHFKWEPRGKRRIHKKPSAREIAACRPWLDAEIEEIQPDIVVCLGATAAQSLLGRTFRVMQNRGKPVFPPGLPPIFATVHPSSILRAPDHDRREQARHSFVHDLRAAAAFLHQHRRAA